LLIEVNGATVIKCNASMDATVIFISTVQFIKPATYQMHENIIFIFNLPLKNRD
jgi:hypothetical protein